MSLAMNPTMNTPIQHTDAQPHPGAARGPESAARSARARPVCWSN